MKDLTDPKMKLFQSLAIKLSKHLNLNEEFQPVQMFDHYLPTLSQNDPVLI